MQGLIASSDYLTHLEHLKQQHPRLAEVVDAIEWDLLRCSNPTARYPLVGQSPKGPVYYLQTAAAKLAPSIIVLFTFEPFGGETKILLLDIKVAEPD
jgi:hypothetical protein